MKIFALIMAVMAVASTIQVAYATDKMWECYKPCYDKYTALYNQATTEEEKARYNGLIIKCTEDCWPGRKPAPQTPQPLPDKSQPSDK